MQSHAVKHTLDIFERYVNRLPPLLPADLEKEINHAFSHLRDDFEITMEQAEDTMIIFGKKIWPHWQAFEEMVNSAKGRMGEKIFLARLSPKVRTKYRSWRAQGMEFREMHGGAAVWPCSSEEKMEIGKALLEMDKDVRQHVRQEILSVKKSAYMKLVDEFSVLRDEMEEKIQELYGLADSEQEHPQLADEIRQKARSFEYGFCLLGPSVQHHEVKSAGEYFKERKKTKRVIR